MQDNRYIATGNEQAMHGCAFGGDTVPVMCAQDYDYGSILFQDLDYAVGQIPVGEADKFQGDRIVFQFLYFRCDKERIGVRTFFPEVGVY